MSAVQALMMNYANPMIVCDSADFDGTNDYMTRGAGLTAAADSKTGILSFWARLDAGDGVTRQVITTSDSVAGIASKFRARFLLTTNLIRVSGFNDAGTEILTLLSTTAYTAAATWLHVLASWDLANAAGSLHVNDVSDLGSSTLTDDTIDYTRADWGIGAEPNAANKMNGPLAELYFAPGQYLNCALVANRRKFISASGRPVHLGVTGALPTGTAPLVYQHLDDAEAVASFATNRGTGGNFTITGTLDTGSTSPSD